MIVCLIKFSLFSSKDVVDQEAKYSLNDRNLEKFYYSDYITLFIERDESYSSK